MAIPKRRPADLRAAYGEQHTLKMGEAAPGGVLWWQWCSQPGGRVGVLASLKAPAEITGYRGGLTGHGRERGNRSAMGMDGAAHFRARGPPVWGLGLG